MPTDEEMTQLATVLGEHLENEIDGKEDPATFDDVLNAIVALREHLDYHVRQEEFRQRDQLGAALGLAVNTFDRAHRPTTEDIIARAEAFKDFLRPEKAVVSPVEGTA